MYKAFYPAFILKSHRGLFIYSILVVALFQFLMVWLITQLDFNPIYSAFLNQLPPQFKLLFTQEFLTRFSVQGAVAFAFNHPFVLAVLIIVAISIPSKHIAGEIEGGTLELILSYPRRRMTHLSEVWFSGNFMLFLIILCGIIASIIAMLCFDRLDINAILGILKVGFNLWLLSSLISSISLMFSVFVHEGNRAGQLGGAIILIFYFLYFIASLWTDIEFSKVLNIFHYYQPQKLIYGERSFLLNSSVLIILNVFCIITAVSIFTRRDIP